MTQHEKSVMAAAWLNNNTRNRYAWVHEAWSWVRRSPFMHGIVFSNSYDATRRTRSQGEAVRMGRMKKP